MKQEIFIKDPEYKVDLKIYYIQSFVYILPNALPTEYSDKIHLLDKFKVMTTSVDRAYHLALVQLDKKYPYYQGHFNFR